MEKAMEKIVLASQSPRRQEILRNIGMSFNVAVPAVDESEVVFGGDVRLYVQELALLKAAASAKKLDIKKNKNTLVISADTVVVSEGEILGKPKDSEDAKRMLTALSGKAHSVVTGICVLRLSDGFSVCDAVETEVFFKKLSEGLIDSYVASKEPNDKAGAYGIQGKGAILVEKINGDYFNVVGLPVSRLCDILGTEFGMNVLNLQKEIN